MRNLLIILITLALTACATSRGFDRGSLRSQLTSQKQITDEDIKKVFALKPQLPKPFKLGVYFAYPRYGYWGWSGEDKNQVLEIAGELKAKNMISDMFVISDSLIEGNTDNKGIRLAAARAGADAVLIINGVSDIDDYNNPLAASYFLLVTPFFVPGSVVDGLFMVNATLWDVRNQYLYLSAEAEGSASETRPAFFTENARVIKTAKKTAMSALVPELLKLFNNVNNK